MNLSAFFQDEFTILPLAWLIFGLLHSILESQSAKNLLKKIIPPLRIYYRLTYNVFSFGTLTAVMLLSMRLSDAEILSASILWEFIGLMFATYGLLIIRIAMKSYGWRQFIGLDQEVEEHQVNPLKQTGLLGHVRHPLYCGVILLYVGAFFYIPTIPNLINIICVIGYILVGIQFEEMRLMAKFGSEYTEYKKRVPMLFPNLK
jgi:protein-S-isoprenylcysteine O-methyltransferase Ste14